jgi:hypothetical protein
LTARCFSLTRVDQAAISDCSVARSPIRRSARHCRVGQFNSHSATFSQPAVLLGVNEFDPPHVIARLFGRSKIGLAVQRSGGYPWPSRQRFDFVVRTRPATEEEVAAAKKKQAIDSPQWESVMYALREFKTMSDVKLTAYKA